MNQFYDVTAISADEKELERVATKYGVKNHHIEMTRTISPLKDIIAVWKLYKYLKKEKPEIIHSHTPKAGIVGMMAAWLAGVPNRFHTVAGLPLLEVQGSKRVILNFVEKLTYRFANKVYPNSFELEKIIIKENFCSSSKLKVIGQGSSNGIDTTHFNRNQIPPEQLEKLRSSLGIQPDDFVFIFVGRLVTDKGINELVQAFKNLASIPLSDLNLETSNRLTTNSYRAPLTPKLLLVGPLETELDALLPETLLEIEQNKSIVSVGYQDDVRPYFGLSNCLVFPSYREGFPNVVLQAGAMGLPSIVSNINGCNEIIEDGFNGLIIPAKNTTALADAMRRIKEELPLYQKLQQQARSKIVANYEQQVVWEALLAEYEKALNKTG